MKNRPIKFRAYHKPSKWMMTPEEVATSMGDGNCDFEDKDTDYMQFTGLLDKNGKEIYEGDIVLHGGNKTPVRWDDSLCAFWIGEILGLWKDDIEIIGNIYENSDLLT